MARWRRLSLCLVLLGATVSPLAARTPLDGKVGRLEGGKVALKELRGEPVLLELWASWCQPCVEQAEIVHDLEPELAERGVSVYALNVGEPRSVVERHLEDAPAAFPVLLDPSQIVPRQLDIGELPALVLLRADGAPAGVRLGLTLREQVLALLDELE